MLVELLAGNPSLDSSVKIFGVYTQDPVHLRQVNTNTARKSGDVSFERGTSAERDDWCAALGAELDDCCNFLGAASEGNRIRGMRCMIGFVFAVLGANRR